MSISHITLFCISFLLTLCFQSCKSSLHEDAETQKPTPPKIAFLNYQIKKNHESVTIKLIQKNIVEGIVKEKSKTQDPIFDGDLKVSQLNSQMISISDFYVKNPLHYSAEFADETGKLSGQEVHLDSADFLVRLQLKPDTKYLAISHYNKIKDQYVFISKDSL